MSLFDLNKYRVFPVPDWGEPERPGDVVITHDDPVFWLTRTVSQNRTAERPVRSQRLMDQLAAQCLAENDIALGIAIVTLHSLRVAGQIDLGLQVLLQLMCDLKLNGSVRK